MPLDMTKADPANQAPLGHNRPPVRTMLADLAADLPAWLDQENGALIARRDELLAAAERVPAAIESEEMAGRIADFIKQLSAAHKAAEAARVAAKEPTLQAGRLVDGFFKKITDPLYAAKQRVEARLTLWQRQKAEEERRRREAEERAAREEAERQARLAAEKAKAAIRGEGDLDEAATARARAAQAEADVETARREAEAKPAELSRTRGDYGATASLRTYWDFKDLDRDALDLEALRPHLALDALEKAVRAFIRAGGRSLRGVTIFENSSTVVR